MANSNQPSKITAILTLSAIAILIGGLGFAAFQLSSASNKATDNNSTESTPQSPDLQNINGQFDDL